MKTMAKPQILVAVGGYLPSHTAGGWPRSIANLVEALGDEFEFLIVTSGSDYQEPNPDQGVVIDEWNTVGRARVFYASATFKTVRKLAELVRATPHDILYLNSFFNEFTIRLLVARRLRLIPDRPVILAPRGEFSEAAVALKRWKKRPYLAVAKLAGLCRRVTWQASSQYESQSMQGALGAAVAPDCRTVVIAPNLVSHVPTSHEPDRIRQAADDPLRICFLSRIVRKKNLDYALRVSAQVTVPAEFHIHGVAEDRSYWQDCQSLIKRLPPNVTTRYHGATSHAEVMSALAQCDLFFLPTRDESFCHVIYEALAAGLPVLVSDRTPWRGLEKLRVGWDLPLDQPSRFVAVIEAQAHAFGELQRQQREHSRAYARAIAADEGAVDASRLLFANVLRVGT